MRHRQASSGKRKWQHRVALSSIALAILNQEVKRLIKNTLQHKRRLFCYRMKLIPGSERAQVGS